MFRRTGRLMLSLALLAGIPGDPLPTTITKYAGNPVITRGAPGTWNHDMIAGQQLYLDARLHKYVMAVSGSDAPLGLGGHFATGLYYADPTNLLAWTQEATNPVLSANATEGNIVAAVILPVTGGYRMYYQSYAGTDGGPRIYAASSPDLLTWTRLNGGVAVLVPGASGAWDSEVLFDPEIRSFGGTYYLFYGGQKTAGGVTTRGIGYATSTDGVTFTKYAGNPILTPAGGESQLNLGAMSLVGGLTDFDMWFDSSTTPGDRYIDHVHTSDGGATWDVRDVGFLTPSVSGWDSTQVFDSAAILDRHLLYLFYAGSNTAGGGADLNSDIGVATMVWP